MPSESWLEQDLAYKEATSESERLRAQIRTIRVEQGRLKRLKSAIPLVAHRNRLIEELAALGDVIRLREDFGTELRGAQEQNLLAENTIDKARAAIEDLDRAAGSARHRRRCCWTQPARSNRSRSG